jgi:hypothetical protein
MRKENNACEALIAPMTFLCPGGVILLDQVRKVAKNSENKATQEKKKTEKASTSGGPDTACCGVATQNQRWRSNLEQVRPNVEKRRRSAGQ